jgi:hypothetical protein
MKTIIVLLVCLFISSSAAAQNTGSIEGDVYLLTQSGDIKKGAAGKVDLVPRARVKRGWNSMCARYDALWAASSKRDSLERASVSEPDEQLAVSIRISARIDSLLLVTNEMKIARMISLGASAPTGISAHYRFLGIPSGEYVLFSSMRLGGKLMTWVVPVTIQNGKRPAFDLDNNNVEEGAPPCGQELPID